MNRKKNAKTISILSLGYILICVSLISIAYAETEFYVTNFDELGETYGWYIFYDSPENYNHLRVDYNINEEGMHIITGVRFYYRSYSAGSNPHSVDIGFYSDDTDDWANYSISDIPHNASSNNWYTFRCQGPEYLIDDDPQVAFFGSDPISNWWAIVGDQSTNGSTYVYNNASGDSWIQITNAEANVELIVENVTDLAEEDTGRGMITTNDFVDAYQVNLNAGTKYAFGLDRIDGSGNLSMRLCSNNSIIDDVLIQSSGSGDPKSMTYIPTESGSYILMVEPEIPSVDIAEYRIYYREYLPLDVDFSADVEEVAAGEYVRFVPTITGGFGPFLCQWDFGDGQTSNETRPRYQYNTPGIFNISLIVTDNTNESFSLIKSNYIRVTKFKPIVVWFLIEVDEIEFEPFDQCNINEDDWLRFIADVYCGSWCFTYLWDFGDGQTSAEDNPAHKYSQQGNYTVSLTAFDIYDDKNETLVVEDCIIVVEEDCSDQLHADFIVDDDDRIIIENQEIQFIFTGNDDGERNISTYEWNFGDGSPISNEQNPIHQYNNPGTYTVTLRIIDENSEFDMEIKTAYIIVQKETPTYDDGGGDIPSNNLGFIITIAIVGIAGGSIVIGSIAVIRNKRRS